MKYRRGALSAWCVLLAGCLARPGGQASAADGAVEMRTGEYEARLLEKVCYTLRDLRWKGRKLLSGHAGAFNGTVLKTILTKGGKTDWVGTGHGHETVESIGLQMDGKDVPVPTSQALTAEEFLFEKRSDLVVFSLQATMHLAPDGLTQTHTYTAKRDSPHLGLLYVFMHSFDNALQQWLVQKPDGTLVSGVFADEGRRPFEGTLTWTALYCPEQKTGVVYVPATSAPEEYHFYWDRKGDNKLYLQLRRSSGNLQAGDQWMYAVRLAGFEASETGWQDAAAALAVRLRDAWKAEKAALK